MPLFSQNLAALQQRYPALAERVLAFPSRDNLVTFEAKDGGIAYALKSETEVQYLTDPVAPLTRIGNQLEANSAKLNDFTIPVMVIGTYPGDELVYIFDLCENTQQNHAQQKIYVCIDSLPCFCAFLQTMDAQRVLLSERVRLFWHEDVDSLAAEFRAKPELSYLFTLVSGSQNGTVNRIMAPFVRLVQERSAETQRLMAENEAYYDAMSDEELAERIEQSGKVKEVLRFSGSAATEEKRHSELTTKHAEGAKTEPLTSSSVPQSAQSASSAVSSSPSSPQSELGNRHSAFSPTPSGFRSQPSAFINRAPRLMTITSSWSTVTQYSTRDLCAAMQAAGWQTRWLNVDGMPTAHYVVKQINEFKPDVFLFINHLRTEAPTIYPANMMFITWIQDTVPQINSRETAQKWNEMASGTPQQGEEKPPALPSSMPGINADKDLLRIAEAEFQKKTQKPDPKPSDICDHRRSSAVNNSADSSLQPATQQHNNPATFSVRKRDLIVGYIGELETYGYLKDRLVEMPMIVNQNIFRPRTLTDEQKAKYGCDVMLASNGSKPTDQIVREILVAEFAALRPETRIDLTTKAQSTPSKKTANAFNDSSSTSCPSSLRGESSSALFGESLLMAIHDHLWTQYRAGRTFTTYQSLEDELRGLEKNEAEAHSLPSRPSVHNLSDSFTEDRKDSKDQIRSFTTKDTKNTKEEFQTGKDGNPSYLSKLSGENSSDSSLQSEIGNHNSAFSSSFSSAYDSLSADDRDYVIQTLFWRLNDIIYRHVVLEWLDEMAQGAEEGEVEEVVRFSGSRLGKLELTTKAQRALRGDQREFPPEGGSAQAETTKHAKSAKTEPLPSSSVPQSAQSASSAVSPSPSSLQSEFGNRKSEIKIHLYGRGWENHPRFAKYAKGELPHGEELSIAYQAARYCLHLSSPEAKHQRMHEILDSGAKLLTRSTNLPAANEPPAKLMIKLANHLRSGGTAPLDIPADSQDMQKITEWIFDYAESMVQERGTKAPMLRQEATQGRQRHKGTEERKVKEVLRFSGSRLGKLELTTKAQRALRGDQREFPPEGGSAQAETTKHAKGAKTEPLTSSSGPQSAQSASSAVTSSPSSLQSEIGNLSSIALATEDRHSELSSAITNNILARNDWTIPDWDKSIFSTKSELKVKLEAQ